MSTKTLISILVIVVLLSGTASAELYVIVGGTTIEKDSIITWLLKKLTVQPLPTSTFNVNPGQTFPLTYQFCAWQGTYTEVSQVVSIVFNGVTLSTNNYALPIGTCSNSFTIQITAPATPGTYYGSVRQVPTFSPPTTTGATTKTFTVVVGQPVPTPTPTSTPIPTPTPTPTPVPTDKYWKAKVYYITQNGQFDQNYYYYINNGMNKANTLLTNYDGTTITWNIEKVNTNVQFPSKNIHDMSSPSFESSVLNTIPNFRTEYEAYDMVFLIYDGTSGGAYSSNYKNPIFFSWSAFTTDITSMGGAGIVHEIMHNFGLKDVYPGYQSGVISQKGCIMGDLSSESWGANQPLNLCEQAGQFIPTNYKRYTLQELNIGTTTPLPPPPPAITISEAIGTFITSIFTSIISWFKFW